MKKIQSRGLIPAVVAGICWLLFLAEICPAGAETLNRQECLNNSDDWRLSGWTEAGQALNSRRLKEIADLYRQGVKAEAAGDLVNAAANYHLANLNMQQIMSIPYYPARHALFEMECKGLHPAGVINLLLVNDVYNLKGKKLLADNLKRAVLELKRRIPEGKKEALLAADITAANIDLIGDLISNRLALIYKGMGISVMGSDQRNLWIRAVLGSGLKFSHGQWQTFAPAADGRFTVETRGVLNGRAFRLDQDSFIVGLAGLAKMAGIKDPGLTADDLWPNTWEYCLYKNYEAGWQLDALAYYDGGQICLQLGREAEARQLFINGMKAHPSFFTEGALVLNDLNGLGEGPREILGLIRTELIRIEKVQNALKDFYLKAPAGIRPQLQAALEHAYFFKSLILGRLLPFFSPQFAQSAGLKKDGFSIISKVVTQEWAAGMTGYGVRLDPERYLVEKVKKEDYGYFKPAGGYWQGCFLDKGGAIVVPGLAYFKEKM
ncbi:MAG: hypothetical protein MUC28_02700 [Planctomycetes bacterium]|nr:hypothetical protein [Planctomycetota bacterium]